MDSVLSKKQEKFILESTAKINLAHGSVRSGKTHSSLLRWVEHIHTSPDDRLYMIGSSQSSIYDNAVEPLMKLLGGYCSWSQGKHILNVAGKDIKVIGANDQGAIRRIQGNTHSGSYVDEMTILPQNFIDMLFTRLSEPHSKLFGTMNPDTPYHPIKKMIDESDGKYVYQLHFDLNDNPVLGDEYKEMLKRMFTGLWYRRYVQGEWCLAEGCIYDCFDRKYHVRSRPPSAAKYWIAGADYGTSNPFAAVLIGINGDVHPGVWIEKEYYWDPKSTGRQKTDGEFADDLEHFLSGYPIRNLYLDPSAESIQVELRKRGIRSSQADNDVINGIRCVANLFSGGDLVLVESCRNLIQEIEGYTWDPKKVKSGEDCPLKIRDHACDAMRYALYTHLGKKPFIKETHSQQKNLMNSPGFGNGHGWQAFNGGIPPNIGGGFGRRY